MDPKELAAAIAEALAPKFEELAESLKPAPAAAPLEEAGKAPLADFIKALDEAELTAPAKALVTAVYENGGDFAAAIEAEKTREAEILEAKKPAFAGVPAKEESAEGSLLEALSSVFGKRA